MNKGFHATKRLECQLTWVTNGESDIAPSTRMNDINLQIIGQFDVACIYASHKFAEISKQAIHSVTDQ